MFVYPFNCCRVWMPASMTLPHPMMYGKKYASKSTSFIKRKQKPRKSKSNAGRGSRRPENHLLRPLMPSFIPPTYGTTNFLRWQSVDAALAQTSPRFLETMPLFPVNHLKQKRNLSASMSSLSHKDHYHCSHWQKRYNRGMDSTTSLNERHRKWSSQPSLCEVSRNPGGDIGSKRRNQSFVSRVRQLLFPSSKKHEFNSMRYHRHPDLASTMGRCRRSSNIDYVTVASDESDLLQTQNDYYGSASGSGNTMTRQPLPNEKAFMISIRNQRQCQS